MTESEREAFRARAFEVIRANIARRGYHAYRIDGGPSPRWIYTIGLHETHGAPELVVAGALYHQHEDVADAIGQLVEELPDVPLDAHETRTVEALGEVDVVPVHPSWVALLLLGAIDFYGRKDVRALQLRPRGDRRTIDTPDLATQFDPEREAPWRWLHDVWPFAFPERLSVMTDLDALRGAPVVDVSRYDDDDGWPRWGLYATPLDPVPPELVRFAPVATFLALDPTIDAIAGLDEGRIAHRDGPGAPWVVREMA